MSKYVRDKNGEIVRDGNGAAIRQEESVIRIGLKLVGAGLGVVFVLVIVVMLIGVGFGTVGRWQARQNAQNQVKISGTEIKNQEQRVQIAQQKAEIRKQDAIGVREAQDEIAKTLTPLYVQYEMTQAIMQIAESGNNSSVIYIPSGQGGIPLVDDVGTTKVGP